MDKFNKLMYALSNILLILMFIVMMFVSSFTIIGAFRNLLDTNNKIENVLNDLYKDSKNNPLIQEGKLSPIYKAYIERLEYKSKGMLDSSTISFLFQIFSLALISAGVYLLSRSHRNLKNAEKIVKNAEIQAKNVANKSEMIGLFVSNGPTSSAIASYFSIAYQMSVLLDASQDKNARIPLIALLSDTLISLKKILNRASRDQIGVEKSQYEFFMNRATEIITNLKKISKEDHPRIIKLLDLCQESNELFESSNFVEIYNEQLSILTKDT